MYYYGVERSTSSLSHYGVKGMRWGVRKAIATGNQKALDRHFRKAAKKLRKLQDIATNSKKYGAKATAYGVAALGTGTFVVKPKNRLTTPVMNAIKKYGHTKLLEANLPKKISNEQLLDPYVKKNPDGSYYKLDISKHVSKNGRVTYRQDRTNLGVVDTQTYETAKKAAQKAKNQVKAEARQIKNLGYRYDLIRAGAGLATVGLGTAAGVNAYRATHGKEYRQKAMNFRNEMDRVFAGTKYAGKYTVQKKAKKRKR